MKIKRRTPWVTDGANEFLKNYINRNSVVLEFGIGGSTIWFADKVKKLVSIEHNKAWFHIIKKELAKRRNIELILHETEQIGDTDYIKSCYAREIDKFPDEYFDLVLVDGRNRVNCFKNSDRVLKTGGYMMLDNSDREELKEVYDFYKDKEYFESSQRPDWKTSWWKK